MFISLIMLLLFYGIFSIICFMDSPEVRLPLNHAYAVDGLESSGSHLRSHNLVAQEVGLLPTQSERWLLGPDANMPNDDLLPLIYSDDLLPPNAVKMRQKIGQAAIAIKTDWNEGSLADKGTLTAALIAQVAERLRLSEIFIPPIAINVLQNTHSPALTGLAIAGLVGVVQGGIGVTWAHAMHSAENTVGQVNEQFPKLVEFAEDIGKDKDRRWYSGIREGATSFLSLGVTPFIVAEKTVEPTTSERESISTAIKMTGRCALFGFFLGLGVGEVATHLPPDKAQELLDVAGNPWLWIGLAYSYEVPRYLSKRKARKAADKQRNQEYVENSLGTV